MTIRATQGDAVSTPTATAPGSASAGRWLAALVLALGSAAACALAAMAWMLQAPAGAGEPFGLLVDGEPVGSVPTWLVGLLGVMLIAAGVATVWMAAREPTARAALAWLGSWAKRHPLLSCGLLLLAAAGTVDVYELLYHPYHHWWGQDGKGGLRAFMLREDLRFVLLTAATLFAGLACLRVLGGGWTKRLASSLDTRPARWVLLSMLLPLLLGGAMAKGALDGLPHFADSLTYLMQGRILHSGNLAIDRPAHTDLFTGSLFFIDQKLDPDTGEAVDAPYYYGKYPIGWPVVVGAFDHVGLGWLANATLMALLVGLTWLAARQCTSERMAVLAAMLLGGSAWAFFNAAHFASHVASACAVMAFWALFLMLIRRPGPTGWRMVATALGAGLCIGYGVLVRPFDAVMFALPAVGMTLVLILRQPGRWLIAGPLIAVGGLVGVGVFLWSTGEVTGHPLVSPYRFEGRWESDWNATVGSCIARFFYQLVELNQAYPGVGVGGMVLAVIGAGVAMNERAKLTRGLGLLLLVAAAGLFFVAATPFGFTTVWWGPRWLLPVAPVLAMLIAVLVSRMMDATRDGHPAAVLGLCLVLGGFLVGVLGRYPGMWWQHRLSPPHLVSGELRDRVEAMGLSNAVVALPTRGYSRAPLDARAGMVVMAVPFEANKVIFVRATTDWQRKAAESFPGRNLWVLTADEPSGKGFVLKQISP